MFMLSGRGVAEIDGGEHEVGPGDFMGFPTPSVAHHLRNDSDDDLVYLVGGERKEMEIAEFPRLGKVVIRVGRYRRYGGPGSPRGFGRLTIRTAHRKFERRELDLKRPTSNV